MTINDAHCHFFSTKFLEILVPEGGGAEATARRLGWDRPGTAAELADRWAKELENNGVSRAVLIASAPGDEESVAQAVARHPSRFVGFFMFNPLAPDADARLQHGFGEQKLRGVCLFPAMHGYRLDDERVARVFEAAAAHGAAVFAHCGVLTIGVRTMLGLPTRFDLRLGDPLALASVASRYPKVPVIVPHFGAGFLREALMALDQCTTIHLDTSSSNSWTRFHPGLSLDDVFWHALEVAGADRLLFGTDSSFFPRGWQRPIFDVQQQILEKLGVSETERSKIFGGNFDRLFPAKV